MTFREEIEKLSLVVTEDEKDKINVYKGMISDLREKLKPECLKFTEKLLGWVHRDGTEFNSNELKRLDKLNLAYTDKEGKRKIMFIGCNTEYPEAVAATIDYMIYDGKVLYMIANEKIRFEAKDN